MSSQRSWLFLLVTICGTALPSCGGPGYPTTDLEGKVTVNGTSAPKGGIMFTPLSGGRGKGVFASVVEGRYEAKGVPVGDIRVTFTLVKETDRTTEVNKIKMREIVDLVPAKYQQGITFEIKAGETQHDFDLTSS